MLKFEDLCVNLHPNWKKVRKMKQIKILFILAITALLMASCLSSSSDSSVTLYSDAAIKSFTLGTLNKYEARDGVSIEELRSALATCVDRLNNFCGNL